MAKRYSAKFKFQVVAELLSGDKSTAQVPRCTACTPTQSTLGREPFWRKDQRSSRKTTWWRSTSRRIAELERLIGRKEVEIALLKNFLGRPG